ncbi:hypothetical protein HKX48_006409 [Thoreauomyces humboldtii]|nr:hypothetical protein HKX48_006409 [Thoreauomyces humboldtii]
MGCGASKNDDGKVVPISSAEESSTQPPMTQANPNTIGDTPSAPNDPPPTVLSKPPPSQTESVAAAQKDDAIASNYEIPVKADAPPTGATGVTEGRGRPVAFEIPLGAELFSSPSNSISSPNSRESLVQRTNKLGDSDPHAGRLPSIGLASDVLQAKLGDAEAKWRDLDDQETTRKKKARTRRNGQKPELTSSTTRPKTRAGRTNDGDGGEESEQLKQRLLEKEVQADRNRQKEQAKLQAKLARESDHVRKVQERKRYLEREDSTEDFAMSAGESSVSGSTQSLVA